MANVLRVLLTGVFLASCTPDPTAIRLRLNYEESWQLTSLELLGGGETRALSARTESGDYTKELFVTLSERLVGSPLTLTLRGYRGEDSARELYASGTVTVTPVENGTVEAVLTLARTACASWCTVGATSCRSGGVATCVARAGECPAWSEPTACGSGETCSLGQCSTSCVDECAAGETRCAGPLQTEICGQADSDSCLDWLAPSLCSGGELCSQGRCAPTCTSECVQGTQTCRDGGISVCGDVDSNGCFEWGPATACGVDESCSAAQGAARCVANSACTDECSAADCGAGVTFSQCGNFDRDSCRERSPGMSCVSPNPCVVGTCDAQRGCMQAPKTCDPIEPTCVNATTQRHSEGVQCDPATGACTATSTREVQCTQCPSDCADPCEGVTCRSSNPCEMPDGRCEAGRCIFTPAAGACDDGDACTVGDACSAGSCAPGTRRSCTEQQAAVCVGNALRTFSPLGMCSVADCVYPIASEMNCAGGCNAGACVAVTPDAGVPDGGGGTDGGGETCESPCGLVPQCGCSAEQACVVRDGGSACEPVGTIPVGAYCPLAQGCVAGSQCFSSPDNVCLELCRTDADCHGGPGAGCILLVGYPTIRGCSLDCDPISGAGCLSGICRFARGSEGRAFTICSEPTGAMGQGGACSSTDACEVGYRCQTGQCMRYCDPASEAPGCPAGTRCRRAATPVVFAGTEYGVCDAAS